MPEGADPHVRSPVAAIPVLSGEGEEVRCALPATPLDRLTPKGFSDLVHTPKVGCPRSRFRRANTL